MIKTCEARKRATTLAIYVVTVAISCATSRAGRAASADIEKFPAKPIRLIVPFVAGVGTDTISRTVAPKLTERWGQQVVVDNRAGAAGSIGVEMTLARLPTDTRSV